MKKQRKISFFMAILLVVMNVIIFCLQNDIAYATNNENTSKPRILLEKYEITDGRLVPGANVKMSMTFKNESATADARDVLVTYSTENNDINPVFGASNQFYIDKIPAKETRTIEVKMEVSQEIDMRQMSEDTTENASKNVKLSMNIKYRTSSGGEESNELNILLPVTQECVLDIKNVSLADNVKLGADSLVSLVYANTGISSVYNVVMHIQGEIPDDQKTSKIGNVGTGAQQAIDYYITLQKEGKQVVKINFTYEDEDGNEYSTEEKEYTIYVEDTATIEPNSADDSQNMNEENVEVTVIQGKDVSIWKICFACIGAIIIILIIVFVTHIKKNKK